MRFVALSACREHLVMVGVVKCEPYKSIQMAFTLVKIKTVTHSCAEIYSVQNLVCLSISGAFSSYDRYDII